MFTITKSFKLPFWPSNKPKCTAGSGEDNGEFGLDGFAAKPETKSYGSVSQKRLPAVSCITERATEMHVFLRQIVMLVAGAWIIYIAVHRMMGDFAHHGLDHAFAPAPAPGVAAAPRCQDYTYPQCEATIHSYLSQNARSRCEAFEQVKAEGDFLKYPFSATKRDVCTEAGCCGCAGQCSKCPPILLECSSWQLDGTWKVAFTGGSEAMYTFDANGHVEARLDESAVPTVWKDYDQFYLAAGADAAPPQLLTPEAARQTCVALPDCKGITYDFSTQKGDKVAVYFKTMAAITPGAGTQWHSSVRDQLSHLQGGVAVAGVLTQISSDPGGTLTFDLHQAAPQLFPAGSIERLSVTKGSLFVTRRIPGQKVVGGMGIRSK